MEPSVGGVGSLQLTVRGSACFIYIAMQSVQSACYKFYGSQGFKVDWSEEKTLALSHQNIGTVT